MNNSLLYLANIITLFLPSSRFFAFKRALYNFAGVTIGENSKLMNVKISGNSKLYIGKSTFIGEDTFITGGIEGSIHIGNNCDISSKVIITTGTHELDITGLRTAGKGIAKSIVIEDGVWIGIGAIILPGTRIGKNSMIAAGSVVTKDIEPYTIAGGVPAKPIKKWCFVNKSWINLNEK